MGVNKTAAIWGFSEATLFFIVPDVWLSIVARDNLKKGLIACFYSLLGALVGGAILFVFALYDFNTVSGVIEAVPAINQDMLSRVHSELTEQGLIAVIMGPLSGTPYKIYVINAANFDFSLWWFLLISIPARLIRFMLVTILSYFLSQLISRKTNLSPLIVILSIWSLFYLGYFYIML
jgi:membrane protein YqaA with SNARE-associated domain